MCEIFAAVNNDNQSVIADAKRLQDEIRRSKTAYHQQQGRKIYAFEVDGLGNASIMDDPNVPSLHSCALSGLLFSR